MTKMPTYQPSPYQTQPPTFVSPLEQLMANSVSVPQSGPSRGALVERAFSLTRSSSVKRVAPREQLASGSAGVFWGLQRAHHVSPSNGNDISSSSSSSSGGGGGGGGGVGQFSSAHATVRQTPPAEPLFMNEHQQTAQPSLADVSRIQRRMPFNDPADVDEHASATNKASLPASTEHTDKERVQHQRAARLSLQQNPTMQTSAHPLGQPRQDVTPTIDGSHTQEASSSSITNAFRDSFASDVSFNSITEPEDRSSIMLRKTFSGAKNDAINMSQHSPDSRAWSTSRAGKDSHLIADAGFEQEADRIAEEVRGLSLRRRQSMDTVRSSEFGDGGRWAKAWASSEDGSDDDEEDEMTLQDMKARDMTDLDIEATHSHTSPTALGALGALGNLQGAYAAISRQAERNVGGQGAALPHLQSAASAVHTVSLTPSQRGSSLGAQRKEVLRAYDPTNGSSSRLSRRDTITSIAGEVVHAAGEDHTSQDRQQQHERSNSDVTISAKSDASINEHVMVWPPTPAGSERSSSERKQPGGQAYNDQGDLCTVTLPNNGAGFRATIESAASNTPVNRPDGMRQATLQQNYPSKPLSPSALLQQQRTFDGGSHEGAGRSTFRDTNQDQKQLPQASYGDPINGAQAGPLGSARRKAIQDHDGRESMVSDLDVETLRLDGSSQAGDSRRDSTSTIGSVSSVELEQQRRRRSQMERYDDASTVYDDRRASTATVRSVRGAVTTQSAANIPQSVPVLYGRASGPAPTPGGILKRNVSHPSPVKEKLDPLQQVPLQPRRSNTMPEEPQGIPKLPAAPWATSARGVGGHTSPSIQSPNLSAAFTSMSPSMQSTNSRAPLNGKRSSAPPAQSQAEKFLTLGISHHESGDLSRSAYYFERSAKVDGGCVVGMCMWGMALREGWGVRKDQKRGFEWISRAASRAGELMSGKGQVVASKMRTEAELKAIRSELKLSVYELGKCFCYGWGVKLDKPMALEYFELAAKLGDADAQAEAGALLAAGKGGCKKDLKKAAMYYRMAEMQGYDTVGLSWIHKDKYDPDPHSATK